MWYSSLMMPNPQTTKSKRLAKPVLLRGGTKSLKIRDVFTNRALLRSRKKGWSDF